MDNTFGVLYISAVMGAVLSGVSNVQLFLYFQAHKSSGFTFYKFAVCWLWLLDALHVCAINHSAYYYLITNYGNLLALQEIVWSLKAAMTIDVILIYSVQLLYLQRMWIISKGRKKNLPAVMTVVVVSASAIASVSLWKLLMCRRFSNLSDSRWLLYLCLGIAALVDCLLASSLCYLLYTAKTGFAKMDMTLHKLMKDIISTGCLTSICAVACIIMKLAMPDNFIFLGIQLILSNLYVNSYLALLNARYHLTPDDGAQVSQISQRRSTQHSSHEESHVGVSCDRFPRTPKVDNMQISDSDDVLEHHTDRHIMMKQPHPIEVVVRIESY